MLSFEEFQLQELSNNNVNNEQTTKKLPWHPYTMSRSTSWGNKKQGEIPKSTSADMLTNEGDFLQTMYNERIISYFPSPKSDLNNKFVNNSQPSNNNKQTKASGISTQKPSFSSGIGSKQPTAGLSGIGANKPPGFSHDKGATGNKPSLGGISSSTIKVGPAAPSLGGLSKSSGSTSLSATAQDKPEAKPALSGGISSIAKPAGAPAIGGPAKPAFRPTGTPLGGNTGLKSTPLSGTTGFKPPTSLGTGTGIKPTTPLGGSTGLKPAENSTLAKPGGFSFGKKAETTEKTPSNTDTAAATDKTPSNTEKVPSNAEGTSSTAEADKKVNFTAKPPSITPTAGASPFNAGASKTSVFASPAKPASSAISTPAAGATAGATSSFSSQNKTKSGPKNKGSGEWFGFESVTTPITTTNKSVFGTTTASKFGAKSATSTTTGTTTTASTANKPWAGSGGSVFGNRTNTAGSSTLFGARPAGGGAFASNPFSGAGAGATNNPFAPKK